MTTDTTKPTVGLEPSDLFVQTVARLVTDPQRRHRIETLQRNIAVLRPPETKERVLLIRYPSDSSNEESSEQSNQAVLAQLKPILKMARHKFDIVLVGGDAGARQVLKKAAPVLSRKWHHQHHVQSDRVTWHGAKRTINAALDRVQEPISHGDWTTFSERIQTDTEEIAEEIAESRDFKAVLKTGPIRATTAFLVMACCVYGAEMALGSPDFPPALVRLGALSAPRILNGAWYRLLSVAFLHGSLTHLFFNMLVLFQLGGFLERLAGTARFTLIFVTSVLAGSLLSVFLTHTPLSVGASGGLWGILAAQAVIAWRGHGVLPKAAIKGARRAAQINLGLNLLVSFLPRVDWAAHLGGCLAGGALMFFLLPGLPRLDAFDSTIQPPPRAPLAKPAWLLSIGLAGALLLSLVVAVAENRPWELLEEPTFQQVRLQNTPVSLDMPVFFEREPVSFQGEEAPNTREETFGDIMKDPVQCTIFALPYQKGETFGSATSKAELKSLFGVLRNALKKNAQGASFKTAPHQVSLNGHFSVESEATYPNGLLVRSLIVFEQPGLARLDCLLWPGQPKFDDIPARMAGSIGWGP